MEIDQLISVLEEDRSAMEDRSIDVYDRTAWRFRCDTGYVPSDRGMIKSLFDILCEIPGKTYLDLGSGKGYTLACARLAGYERVVGIELSDELSTMSVMFLDELTSKGLIPEGGIEVINSSYYPKEFIERRKDRVLPIDLLEAEILKTRDDHYYPRSNAEGEPDVLELVSFRDVDVFYAYLWPGQVPSVLELFSRYARVGAMMVTEGYTRKGLDLLDDLGLSMEPLLYPNGNERNFFKIKKESDRYSSA